MVELIACHACDRLYHLRPMDHGGVARCTRCGAVLYRQHCCGMITPLALSLATIILLALVNLFPLLTFKVGGQEQSVTLLAGVRALLRHGMGEVALLVLLTSILAPLLHTLALLHVLIPIHLRRQPWQGARVFKLALLLAPWAMLGVTMLAIMVAMVKLKQMAGVVPETALFALAALLPVATAVDAALDPHRVWERLEPQP